MLILQRDDQVLLARRRGTGYADGLWNLPSGKLELGESISTAAVRECREEVGVEVTEEELEVVHVMHHRNVVGDARLAVFFLAHSWRGEPVNREPEKCSQVAWWPLACIPSDTYVSSREGLQAYNKNIPYMATGW